MRVRVDNRLVRLGFTLSPLAGPTSLGEKISHLLPTAILFEIDRIKELGLAVNSVDFENLLEKESGKNL